MPTGLREKKGRPRVFDDVRQLTLILYRHAPKNVKFEDAFLQYTGTVDEPVCFEEMEKLKPVMLEMAKFAPNLRLSHPSLSAAIRTVYGPVKDVKTKSALVAEAFNAACRVWLRDIKDGLEWTKDFGIDAQAVANEDVDAPEGANAAGAGVVDGFQVEAHGLLSKIKLNKTQK